MFPLEFCRHCASVCVELSEASESPHFGPSGQVSLLIDTPILIVTTFWSGSLARMRTVYSLVVKAPNPFACKAYYAQTIEQ